VPDPEAAHENAFHDKAETVDHGTSKRTRVPTVIRPRRLVFARAIGLATLSTAASFLGAPGKPQLSSLTGVGSHRDADRSGP
jgi:hypothetical protein